MELSGPNLGSQGDPTSGGSASGGEADESEPMSGSDLDVGDENKSLKQSWYEASPSPRYMEMDDVEEPKYYHSEPLFILNRNGKSDDELWDIFEAILERDYPEEEDLHVNWVSTFGKQPERPHAFVIITDPQVMNDYKNSGEAFIEIDDEELYFDINHVDPLIPEKGFEKKKLYVTGLPTEFEEVTLKENLTDFLNPIADVKEVILPKSWKQRRHAFVDFHDEVSASYVARVAKVADFHGSRIHIGFAKIQVPRERKTPSPSTSPPPRLTKKHPNSRKSSWDTAVFRKPKKIQDVRRSPTFKENTAASPPDYNPYASLSIQ